MQPAPWRTNVGRSEDLLRNTREVRLRGVKWPSRGARRIDPLRLTGDLLVVDRLFVKI